MLESKVAIEKYKSAGILSQNMFSSNVTSAFILKVQNSNKILI